VSEYTEAPFYDVAMVEDGAPAMVPWERSGWKPLYEEIASWIDPFHDVVDLGCGTGRFAACLAANGHMGGYVGIDFSDATLTEASRYMASRSEAMTVEWRQEDLREWQPSRTRGNCTYVCTETLEHLADDQDLVRRIPPGHRLILSVPSYDDVAHIRAFRHAGEVWGRYEHLLAFRRWHLIDVGGERWKIHLCDTMRRSDTW